MDLKSGVNEIIKVSNNVGVENNAARGSQKRGETRFCSAFIGISPCHGKRNLGGSATIRSIEADGSYGLVRTSESGSAVLTLWD